MTDYLILSNKESEWKFITLTMSSWLPIRMADYKITEFTESKKVLIKEGF